MAVALVQFEMTASMTTASADVKPMSNDHAMSWPCKFSLSICVFTKIFMIKLFLAYVQFSHKYQMF